MSPTNTDSLTVIDNRNGKKYVIPISTTTHDTSVAASAFKDIVHQRTNGEKQGLRVTDRGFLNTAVIQSSVTFIDGDKGILRYRGYPIEQLAANSNFLESAYLLIWGELPTKNQYDRFHDEIMNHSTMHVDAEEIFRSFRYGEFKRRAGAIFDTEFFNRCSPHVYIDERLCCARELLPRGKPIPPGTNPLHETGSGFHSKYGQTNISIDWKGAYSRCYGIQGQTRPSLRHSSPWSLIHWLVCVALLS
jgi:hypothetical protein